MTTRIHWRRPSGRWVVCFASVASAMLATGEEAYLPRLGPAPLRFGGSFPFLTPPHLAADYDPRVEAVPPVAPTNSPPVVSTNTPAAEPPVVRVAVSPRPEPAAITNTPPPPPLDALDAVAGKSNGSNVELVNLFRKAVKTTNGVQEVIVPMPFIPGTPGESQSSRATYSKP